MMKPQKRLTPPLKWHGGKHYLAREIVAMMPPHIHYVEPYAGGLAVLLARNPDGVSEVANDVQGLPAVHARLMRVAILNRPALDVIRQQDGPETLFYCDPPYLKATRTAPEVYGKFEMSEADHQQLLETLCLCKGKVMLSGYPSVLYDDALSGWTPHTFDLPNNAAGGKAKDRETEVVWCNF